MGDTQSFPVLVEHDDVIALPTDSRNKQKERLKQEKEAGIKPRKIPKHVEDGHDDCGADLKGLETMTATTLADSDDTDLDSDGDDYVTMTPNTLPIEQTGVFHLIPSL